MTLIAVSVAFWRDDILAPPYVLLGIAVDVALGAAALAYYFCFHHQL